ncbi:toprim domain-containing protein [Marinobacter sp. UBA3607]|jgi:putative DNA primase/helicase|uniref:toprim domain-containing protein n=1 Tax=Marinobacter sp. UBA3607 TaxID=1946820 RepID=UPI000E994380|nr:toprim domain-containing protein [Marinobacter sp. UBA3607]HBM48724.1 topoisomerase [Marinobacter sp.]|tara:strand:- start:3482 stop:4465 length:984 start_codon:yes stop_codon:yes gene_type:complete
MKTAPAPEGARHQTQTQYSNATAGGYAERLDSIRAALLEAGIEPANPDALLSRLADAEGKPVRFGTASKPRSKNGWLIAYHDRGLPFVVIAGDWSTGAETKWVAGTGDTLNPAERRELKRRMAEAKRAREEEQARQWEARAAAAARHWHSCTPADPLHPYLQRKGIQPHRARQLGRELVLLLADFNGKAWSLQTIDEAGDKRLMAGGKKAGNFIVVDGPDYPARVLICEGWATGCTLAEIDPAALVLAAVDCGNLQTVTTGARNRWPDADLIVCGDDDRQTPGNPGAAAARAAALAAGARFALPEWPPAAPLHLSDFNDLHNWQGGR